MLTATNNVVESMTTDRTEAQRAASRTNGAKSHGPTSVMGKRISSRHSLKQGPLADVLLLPDESRDSLLVLFTNTYDVFRVRIRDYEAAALMVEISAQGPHPEIPIDDKIWAHPAARGSMIQTSKMRYLRESKEAQTQLFKLRENSTKWLIPANEHGTRAGPTGGPPCRAKPQTIRSRRSRPRRNNFVARSRFPALTSNPKISRPDSRKRKARSSCSDNSSAAHSPRNRRCYC